MVFTAKQKWESYAGRVLTTNKVILLKVKIHLTVMTQENDDK